MAMMRPRPYPTNCRKAAAGIILLSISTIMAGCATSKDKLLPLPHNGLTMQQLWQQGVTGATAGGLGARALEDARSQLRRPIGDGEMAFAQARYTRDAANEIYSQFSRLPNPDLVMYIYPHTVGAESTPVPGYSTVFPFYTTPQYAMPGEGPRPAERMR